MGSGCGALHLRSIHRREPRAVGRSDSSCAIERRIFRRASSPYGDCRHLQHLKTRTTPMKFRQRKRWHIASNCRYCKASRRAQGIWHRYARQVEVAYQGERKKMKTETILVVADEFERFADKPNLRRYSELLGRFAARQHWSVAGPNVPRRPGPR